MSKAKYTIIAAVVAALLSQVPTAEAAKAKARKINTDGPKQSAKVVSLLNSARKQVDKGKMQDAINTYWKVLELDSTEPYAYLELGELYKNLRIYDRSVEMLTSGLDLAKELDGDTICNYYCILVEVYSLTDQQGLANKALIKAAEASPRNPMPRKILGDIYLKNNRVANAYKAYKKSLELDPYYQPAVDAMNSLKAEYGDKLPKEDKDSEYIKRVAVKLNDEKAATESAPSTATEKPETTNNGAANTISAQADTEEQQVAEAETEVPTQPSKPKLANNNDRPIPLKAEDMPKPKPAKKKAKQQKLTDEDIAIAEAETAAEDQQESEPETEEALAEAIDKNMDKFLEGNYTEKEEALTFFTKCGKPGLSAVEELLYDRNPEIRLLAVRALLSFDQFPDDVKAILNDASDDSDEEVAEEVRKALNLL